MDPCYAIIPAAGSSRRMGQPKLLLPWPSGKRSSTASSGDASRSGTIIDRVLEAWTTSRVSETIIVVRKDDAKLRDACGQWPVTVVHPPQPTLDMRESICVGLNELNSRPVRFPKARCFIAPADIPGLTSQVINRMLDQPIDDQTVLIPRFGTSIDNSVSGHPVLLPWPITHKILALRPDTGVDSVVKSSPSRFVLFPPELNASDVDTFDEYEKLRGLEN